MLAVAWLISCHKNPDRKVIIQGRVIEYGTGTPIAGARIYVLCYDGPILGAPSSYLTDSILTDADGQFYREYSDDTLCNTVYLIPFKEGYFKGPEIDLTTDNRAHEVVLDPEAWLKLVTIPDLGQYSHLGFGGTFSPHSVDAIKGIESQVFVGRGGREVVLHWGPSAGVVFSDSIYLVPHDTTIYTIHY